RIRFAMSAAARAKNPNPHEIGTYTGTPRMRGGTSSYSSGERNWNTLIHRAAVTSTRSPDRTIRNGSRTDTAVFFASGTFHSRRSARYSTFRGMFHTHHMETDPAYRDLLAEHGLARVEEVLARIDGRICAWSRTTDTMHIPGLRGLPGFFVKR